MKFTSTKKESFILEKISRRRKYISLSKIKKGKIIEKYLKKKKINFPSFASLNFVTKAVWFYPNRNKHI